MFLRFLLLKLGEDTTSSSSSYTENYHFIFLNGNECKIHISHFLLLINLFTVENFIIIIISLVV